MACESLLQSIDTSPHFLSSDSSQMEWLSPRVSFSDSFPQLDEAPVGKQDRSCFSTDFEFSMFNFSVYDSLSGGSAMLPADELFYNGKLLPLQPCLQPKKGDAQTRAATVDQEATPLFMPHSLAGQEAISVLDLGHPCLAFCSSPQRGTIAPPSPETPRCSILLRDFFGAKKAQGNGSNRFVATSKLWKLLVGSNTGAEKKAAKLPTFSKSFPTSPISQPISCHIPSSTVLHQKQHHRTRSNRQEHQFLPDVNSMESLLSRGMNRGRICRHSEVEVESNRRCSSGRSISMPSSRWSSPERAQVQTVSEKSASRENESASIVNSRRVQSSRIILKNPERCRGHQKGCSKLQEEGDVLKLLAYRRAPEKVSSYGSSVRVTPVLNVPTCLSPSIKNGKSSKSKLEKFRELFLLKKENPPKVSLGSDVMGD
ncbi:hypothetical protein O6H91_07G031200 [Diphasiastrum complanatum]|uniref:Uncharacterized protein n=2 Tax=Diphasiastrum complanatum TaxID=34168 RepID=A0ACC2D3K0_DIPCM|nr:hypothetical protein O6H91_07G031200 [Diphasiastrum complanatum]